MTQAELDSFEKWLKGIPYEIAFWKSYYGHSRSLRDLDSWSEYGKVCRLDGFDIMEFARECGGSPLFVDLGCALSYAFGTEFPGIDVRIDRLDPLARFYNRILDRYAPERPRIRFGMIESVSAVYEPGAVDLIHVRNALDHCADPLTGVIESLACLRVGGVLYLNHHRNEAVRDGYRGFHQFNVDICDGRLVVWNRERRIDLADELRGVATVECSVTDRGLIVGVIRKIAELPSELYDAAESKRRMAEMLQLTVESMNSLKSVVRYHFAALTASVAHPVMRRLPYGLVAKLKKLISG